MNLTSLAPKRLASAAVRTALSAFYRPGHFYTVRFGPLRGLKLYYDRTVTYHIALGLSDPAAFDVLTRLIKRTALVPPDSAIADVGANVGYYALWFAKSAVPRGRVYAFEPTPGTATILKSNIQANHLTNLEAVELACADRPGTTEFFVSSSHTASSFYDSHAAGGGKGSDRITVALTTLDDFFGANSGRQPPRLIKIDIEGAGTLALPGATKLIAATRPLIVIESHDPDEDRAIADVLATHSYDAFRINTRSWVENPSGVHPDPNGVWGTMVLTPREHRSVVAAAMA